MSTERAPDPAWASRVSTYRAALMAIAVVGLIARAAPLIGANAVEASASFDEGVYLQAAGLFSEGLVPYRDFALLHPPGSTLLGWPVAEAVTPLAGWDGFLAAGRWLGVLVGVANILLVAALARRWQGPAAGLVAAALYAGAFAAVDIEQHFLLEPFVNLFVLLGALCWLGAPRGPTTRSALAAGALIGAAALVKLTGGLALLALLASGPWRSALRQRAVAVGAAALTFAAAVVPFAALAGAGRMFDLIVSSQLQRPGGDAGGGSISGIAARLASTVRFGLAGLDPVGVAPRVLLFAAAVGILVWAWRRGRQHGRFWAALFAVELGAVIAAPDFYVQYAVPMAPPLAICAGAWLAAHAHRVADRRLVVAGAATVLALGIGAAIRKGIVTPDRGGASFGALVDRHLGADECLFTDPPYLALAADRLLPREGDGSVLIDPFGALIAAALNDGGPPTTTAALTSASAQRRIRGALSRCGAVALVYPPRAHPHMSAATAAWFVDRYEPVGRAAGHATLWERHAQPGP